MAYKPFKMKGSPVKRSFGVGRRELDRGGSLFKFTIDDLKKKSGFGPRASKGEDDQSRELAISRYEMGMYKHNPFETDAEVERREDAEGK